MISQLRITINNNNTGNLAGSSSLRPTRAAGGGGGDAGVPGTEAPLGEGNTVAMVPYGRGGWLSPESKNEFFGVQLKKAMKMVLACTLP
mgnify:CR=1 FL=1